MSCEPAYELSRILSQAETRDELAILLQGLLTPRELEETVFRWLVMKRLLAGETQRDIAAELRVSLGKIARGSRLLQYGPPEFRRLVEKINKKEQR